MPTLTPLLLALLLGPASQESAHGIHDREGRRMGPEYSAGYALLVEVRNYEGAWPDYFEAGTELVEGALKQHGFVVRKIIDPDGRTLRSELRNFFTDFGTSSGNQLFVYFSGHGYTDKAGRGFLIPVDAPEPEDESGLADRALALKEVADWADTAEASHIIFLLNSCLSDPILDQRVPKQPPTVTATTSLPIRQFMTFGSEGDRPPESQVFSDAVVQALEGRGDGNGDGYITGTELAMFIHRRLDREKGGRIPRFGESRNKGPGGGDFVFTTPRSRRHARAPLNIILNPASIDHYVRSGRHLGTSPEIAREILSSLISEVPDPPEPGDALSTYLLADYLFNSAASERAARYYRRAADEGHLQAMYMLGHLYWHGKGGFPQSFSQAREWYVRAAEDGHADSMYEIGHIYAHGLGVPEKPDEAVQWFQRSASAGSAKGMTALGYSYRIGQGSQVKNDEKALSLYLRAADLGEAQAMNNLGNMYMQGEGVRRSYEKAFYWLTRALESGYGDIRGDALTNLGLLYMDGLGVPRDLKKAASHFRSAAAYKSATAMSNLGFLYHKGNLGFEADALKAEHWYKEAAKLGSPDAMVNLGDLYLLGSGAIDPDFEKGAYWLRRAADKGDRTAWNNLGVVYENGLGLPRDESQAFDHYRQSASLGYPLGMANLGRLYLKGVGVEQSRKKGNLWMRRAARLGNEIAQKTLKAAGEDW